MTDLKTSLGTPSNLAEARGSAHAAVQPLTRAARANLEPAPDDGHSNLEWSGEKAMFLTHMLGGDIACQVGLKLAPLRLVVLGKGDVLDELALASQSIARAQDWVDSRLGEMGLEPGGPVKLPYDLPARVADIDSFGEDSAAFSALAAWYSLAEKSLTGFAKLHGDLDPGPSPVRCWPHHFDIATYVGLEAGDFETAKGVGVGLSPGDDAYDQPYFYVNPWPHLDAAALPDAIPPGHWHTAGFVGSIATGDEILSLGEIETGTAAFLEASFNAGRASLGV